LRLYHSHLFAATYSDKVLDDARLHEPEILNDTEVIVDWDLTPDYSGYFEERNVRINEEHGRLVFQKEDKEKILYFKIYRRQFHEMN
jgi:hypothetical protein